MIISKNLKAALFKAAARFHFLNWLFLLIIAFGIVSWTTTFLGSLESNLWRYILISALGLLSFFAWILLWGWYSVWFRYLAYGVARMISGIRVFFSSTFIQMVIILGLSGWFWLWRKRALQGGDYDLKDLLRLTSALKILVVAAAIFTVWQVCKSRKRIVILDFVNHTGDENLNPAVEGIATRCLNEMSRRLKLLKTVNEIQPEPKKNLVEPTMDVQNIGKGFEEIIGPESSVKVGAVSIPLRPLYTFFQKLFHGPMLKGGVQLTGNKLILIACLYGGGFKENWEITLENLKEIEKSPASATEQLVEMTNLLVCRILTDLSPEITPRWKAMYHFSEGLWFYRETWRTEEKRKMNLIKAKYAFSLAVRDDEEFVQCYYNFGIIYKKLKSWEAAKAAFCEALKKKPDYHRCYYQLALIYFYADDYFNARCFCDHAIAICPTNSDYWNLLAKIHYSMWWDEKGKKETKGIKWEIVWTLKIGTMLAWRALCKSIIKGEKIQEFKQTALLCTRNLAIITGQKKLWRSRFYFNQAIFIDPDNNDLLFESGKYYYWRQDIFQSYQVFKRVFEDDKDVGDPFSYWAFYINVNAQLCGQEKNEKKKKEYEDVVDNGYVHFLDAAAEIIHNKVYDINDIKLNEELVLETFALIKEKKEYHQSGILLKFINFLKDEQRNINTVDGRKETNKLISRYSKRVPDDFLAWMEAQLAVKSSTYALKKKTKNYFEYAKSRLEFAIKKLKNNYKKEIKILGLYRYLAMAYLLIGSYEEALNSAREAVNLNPYDPDVREVLGEVYFKLKGYRQAVIEFEISFNVGKPSLHILEKIGEAYKEEGKILRDPVKRKESFTKAADFFKECYDIIDDKSYEANVQDDESYIETQGKIHFNLAYFHRELLNYDAAISHYQSSLEMAKALKSNVDILETLLQMGWVYLEAQAFTEAEKAFNDVKSYNDVLPLIKTEIDIGLMFSNVERAISIDRNVRLEDTAKAWAENTETSMNEKDKEFREKARLLSLYHECLGRYFSLQGKMEEAEKEFEKSISFMPTPRVYLYLAEFYLREISESRIGRKEALMAKTRNACKLCRQTDLRLQYKQDVDDLEKKLEAREK